MFICHSAYFTHNEPLALKGGCVMQLHTAAVRCDSSSFVAPQRCVLVDNRPYFQEALARILNPETVFDADQLAAQLNTVPELRRSRSWETVMLSCQDRIVFAFQNDVGLFESGSSQSLDAGIQSAASMSAMVAMPVRDGDDLFIVVRDPTKALPREFEVVFWSMAAGDLEVECMGFVPDAFYGNGDFFSVKIPFGAIQRFLAVMTPKS
ncbi:MAG: hypothetical protein KIH65_000125 [Candidatus Uhrbacteria bacterium]|nr:hypothetical protein [Candidatus Uhrbacteria bacterium]